MQLEIDDSRAPSGNVAIKARTLAGREFAQMTLDAKKTLVLACSNSHSLQTRARCMAPPWLASRICKTKAAALRATGRPRPGHAAAVLEASQATETFHKAKSVRCPQRNKAGRTATTPLPKPLNPEPKNPSHSLIKGWWKLLVKHNIQQALHYRSSRM